MSKKMKVLVVDDSPLMRLLICQIIEEQFDFQVIDTAINGKEASEKNMLLLPEIIVLDIFMKDYDGFYAIEQIMKLRPVPIIVLSSSAHQNPDLIQKALELGAWTWISKPQSQLSPNLQLVAKELHTKIRQAGNLNQNFNTAIFKNPLPYQIVAIGASTGGTEAIEQIIRQLPANFPLPILIVLHIPIHYLQSFAKRIQEYLKINVEIVLENTVIENQKIYFIPTYSEIFIYKNQVSKQNELVLGNEKEIETRHSIDQLMNLVANIYKKQSIGVLLTGMGEDGVEGMTEIFKQKGYTMAQDQATSLVFGMPKKAIEKGCIKKIVPLGEIGRELVKLLQ